MEVRRISITNFRGIKNSTVVFDGHTLLVGGNSAGKSTVCEALDLVLGPERMYRRPVVDEHDFHATSYIASGETSSDIEIQVVLSDLSEVAVRRFKAHLRKWDPSTQDFADETPDALARSSELPWCLPVMFAGRFNAQEDDFEGGTFFSHPRPVIDDLTLEDERLGAGRRSFTREDKRHCGYLYLRPNRTGTRSLSLQRGSLLDTIIRLESDSGVALWEKLREDLSDVELAPPASALAGILDGVASRIEQFLSLSNTTDRVEIHASELTREHIREVLRVFIASKPGTFPVPFNRLSTGSLNLLVFALLTYIAELKGDEAVIFAIEEPEIAIPPHSQRRLVDFAMKNMGQAIVTSHSPYVIERFEPKNILVLDRNDEGTLTSGPVALPDGFRMKRYRQNRHQFAEAVLARAVLIVEGATEASLIPVVADVMDADPSIDYTHLDLAGVSVFDAGNDVSVPLYAPLFKSLGKPVYGMHDTLNRKLSAEEKIKADAQAADFSRYTVIPYAGVEDLLLCEMPMDLKRRFLVKAADRDDYPGVRKLTPGASDDDVDKVLREVLKARKGANDGYAADLVAEATQVSELPASLVQILRDIDGDLSGLMRAASAVGKGLADQSRESSSGESEKDNSGDSSSSDPSEES